MIHVSMYWQYVKMKLLNHDVCADVHIFQTTVSNRCTLNIYGAYHTHTYIHYSFNMLCKPYSFKAK